MKTKLLIFLFVLISCLSSRAVILAWDASDGPDTIGYRVKWGFEQGGPYPHIVEAHLSLTVTIEEPWPLGSTVYFTAYAYNTLGIESLPSNEVAYTVPTPTPTPTPPPPTPNPTPAPPDNLRLILDAIARWWANLFST